MNPDVLVFGETSVSPSMDLRNAWGDHALALGALALTKSFCSQLWKEFEIFVPEELVALFRWAASVSLGNGKTSSSTTWRIFSVPSALCGFIIHGDYTIDQDNLHHGYSTMIGYLDININGLVYNNSSATIPVNSVRVVTSVHATPALCHVVIFHPPPASFLSLALCSSSPLPLDPLPFLLGSRRPHSLQIQSKTPLVHRPLPPPSTFALKASASPALAIASSAGLPFLASASAAPRAAPPRPGGPRSTGTHPRPATSRPHQLRHCGQEGLAPRGHTRDLLPHARTNSGAAPPAAPAPAPVTWPSPPTRSGIPPRGSSSRSPPSLSSSSRSLHILSSPARSESAPPSAAGRHVAVSARGAHQVAGHDRALRGRRQDLLHRRGFRAGCSKLMDISASAGSASAL
ncbi:proline-rich receptor-like protein kinase PERK8 [Triticum aestivum]|uniref:proline-rich receptor-like protein kinase PERK8 n=1 Tax=Triticum aestivum TaxID=4565 RepID=UPI001D019153|nr:proline-rich receptor-like protein kinase PERK8 [Triticum aestivum]